MCLNRRMALTSELIAVHVCSTAALWCCPHSDHKCSSRRANLATTRGAALRFLCLSPPLKDRPRAHFRAVVIRWQCANATAQTHYVHNGAQRSRFIEHQAMKCRAFTRSTLRICRSRQVDDGRLDLHHHLQRTPHSLRNHKHGVSDTAWRAWNPACTSAQVAERMLLR